MVELLRYLEAHGFTNYIASGGGRGKSLELAHEYEWTVVSIMNDWREVFEE